MNKVKKFRLSPRPASVLKNLKALSEDPQVTPELESAVADGIRRAVGLYATAALYDTFDHGKTPATLDPLWEKPADAAGNPVALTLYAATVGAPLEEELGGALSRGEGLMSRILTAVGEESAEQAAAFVARLAAEEAVAESCELSPRRDVTEAELRRAVLDLLGASKIGVAVDGPGHLLPRFTRVGAILWFQAKKRK